MTQYPKMLYRDKTLADGRVVESDDDLKAATKDGFKTLDEIQGNKPPKAAEIAAAAADQAAEIVRLTDQLAEAKALTDQLDEAGRRIAGERDDARRGLLAVQNDLSTAQGVIEDLTTKLAEAKAELAKVDPDGDGKVGGSKAKI